MGWELFCEVTWPHETPKRCQKLHSMCVFYKIDSGAKCAWACACCSVCLLHICSLLCACAPYCIGGMNCCSPVHTHTNKRQAAEAAVSQLYWYNTWVTYSCLLSTYSHPGLKHRSHTQFSCTAHVSQFEQLNISSIPVYLTNIKR